MGGYGFLRFSLPMFPLASADFAPFIFTLSVVAIIYTSLVALMQEDMKKLIAYSSVAHMGFVTMGIFAVNAQGVQGAIFQMLSHGIVSGALFLCVGVIYDRMHTREIAAYGGLVNRMPLYAAGLHGLHLANVGLPGTSGFVGEFLTLLGAFQVNTWVAFFATTGMILSAGLCALALPPGHLRRAGQGQPPVDPRPVAARDRASSRRWSLLTIFFGFYPGADHDGDRRLGRPARQQLPGGAVGRRQARGGRAMIGIDADDFSFAARPARSSSSRSARWCC